MEDYTSPGGRIFTRGHWQLLSIDEAEYLRTMMAKRPEMAERFEFAKTPAQREDAWPVDLAAALDDEDAGRFPGHAIIVSGDRMTQADAERVHEAWARSDGIESFHRELIIEPDTDIKIIELKPDPWVRGEATEAAKAEAAEDWPFAKRARRRRKPQAHEMIGPGDRRWARPSPILCDNYPIV